MKGRIPKIIHQSFPADRLTPELKKNIRRIKQLNPEWRHCFYDDADISTFIEQHYGIEMLSLYEQINPEYGAARADLFRYLLIFKLGGVWLDIKSAPTVPLDQVLKPDDYFVLSQWKNQADQPFPGYGIHDELKHIPGGEYQQWHIISVQGNPALAAVIKTVAANIENYNLADNGVGIDAVLRTTGPIAYTLAIESMLDEIPHRYADSIDELQFSYSIFMQNIKPSRWQKLWWKLTGQKKHKHYEAHKHKRLSKVHYSQLNTPLILE